MTRMPEVIFWKLLKSVRNSVQIRVHHRRIPLRIIGFVIAFAVLQVCVYGLDGLVRHLDSPRLLLENKVAFLEINYDLGHNDYDPVMVIQENDQRNYLSIPGLDELSDSSKSNGRLYLSDNRLIISTSMGFFLYDSGIGYGLEINNLFPENGEYSSFSQVELNNNNEFYWNERLWGIDGFGLFELHNYHKKYRLLINVQQYDVSPSMDKLVVMVATDTSLPDKNHLFIYNLRAKYFEYIDSGIIRDSFYLDDHTVAYSKNDAVIIYDSNHGVVKKSTSIGIVPDSMTIANASEVVFFSVQNLIYTKDEDTNVQLLHEHTATVDRLIIASSDDFLLFSDGCSLNMIVLDESSVSFSGSFLGHPNKGVITITRNYDDFLLQDSRIYVLKTEIRQAVYSWLGQRNTSELLFLEEFDTDGFVVNVDLLHSGNLLEFWRSVIAGKNSFSISGDRIVYTHSQYKYAGIGFFK